MHPYIYSGLNSQTRISFRRSIELVEVNGKTLEEVITAVCKYFNVTEKNLKGSSRLREMVIPRQVAIHIIKQLIPEFTLMGLGSEFNRHHSTIIYNIDTANNLIEYDIEFRHDYNEVLKLL